MPTGIVSQPQAISVELAPGEKLVVTSPNAGCFGKLWVYDLAGRDPGGLVPMPGSSTKVLGPFTSGRRVSIEPDSGALSYSFRAYADVAIYGGSPGVAAVGASFGFGVTAQGGVGPLTFSLSAGTLPAGLSFSTTTGTISGVPTTVGLTTGLNISVTDGFQTASLGSFSINVLTALGPTTASFSTSATSGTLIATLTGLASGETATSISPNDGRVVLGGGGTTLVTGMTASSAGTTNYTITTNLGRTLGVAVTASAVTSYLGQVATRSVVPNSYAAGQTYWRTRRKKFARDNLAAGAWRIVVPNWYAAGGYPEGGSGAATTVTAAIEYPAGTFTQVTFSGVATGSIPDVSMLVSDPVNVSVPKGAGYYERYWCNNPNGMVYSSINSQNATVDDFFQYSNTALSDTTMGGTITSNSYGQNCFSSCAVIAQTTLPSGYFIGDSRCAGLVDTVDASLDMGEIARFIGPNFAYINGGVGSDTLLAFINSHANRLALANYCSIVVIQSGINDLYGGTSAAILASRRATIAGYFPGKQVFETTMPPETNTTDNYATTTNQTPKNPTYETQRVLANNAVRAGNSGMTGYFEVADVVESARNSGLWKANGTAQYYVSDGVHETQASNLLIQAALQTQAQRVITR